MKFPTIRILCVLLTWVLVLSGCSVPPALPPDTTPSTVNPTTQTTVYTKPTTEPTVQSTTAPTTAPTTQPTAEPTTVPTTAPGTEPTTQPTAPPATQPTVPPATQPVTPPPTTQPTVPATQPTTPATQPTVPVTQPTEATTGTEATVPLGGEAAIPNITSPVASGVLVKSNTYAVIDYSNTKDGYIMVNYTAATEQRLKVQVKGPATVYTYNLTPQQWAAFPLSDENGSYQITVYRNVSGTSYAVVLSLTVSVTMEDEFSPFLRSNQYVNFDAAPNTVAKAAALAGHIGDPLKKVEAIYNFVVQGMTYDKELAANVQSGYLPNLDSVLSKMTGICFDYAALMTGMLRSQGVPTKLVVGYAGDVYHAWINVWSANQGWIDGVIFFDGTSWKRMDPTFASSGNSSSDIMDYIGNGANYVAKYFY